jgi:hypothetical protein
MDETSTPSYKKEGWYAQMSDAQKKDFDSWYKGIIEIANIKEEIFETSYGLKGSNYVLHPIKLRQLVSRARKIIPRELLTERLEKRLNELEKKLDTL